MGKIKIIACLCVFIYMTGCAAMHESGSLMQNWTKTDVQNKSSSTSPTQNKTVDMIIEAPFALVIAGLSIATFPIILLEGLSRADYSY